MGEENPAEDGRATPAEYRVRCAAPGDADGVAALFVQCVGGRAEEHRRGFLGEITGGRAENLVLIAEAGGEIVGFARARRFEPPPDAPQNVAPAGWYLLGVNVSPAHRRRGVGAALTRERLRWIAGRAADAFYFTERGNRASIALHERFGFEQLGSEVEFPGAPDSTRDRVLYRMRFPRHASEIDGCMQARKAEP